MMPLAGAFMRAGAGLRHGVRRAGTALAACDGAQRANGRESHQMCSMREARATAGDQFAFGRTEGRRLAANRPGNRPETRTFEDWQGDQDLGIIGFLRIANRTRSRT
ncbi:MAG: hypothetical protein HQL40_13260 [Alphaproteobacteria bacterium]|nr:hypothetical protein [Alphaproteobacteria bacterium]